MRVIKDILGMSHIFNGIAGAAAAAIAAIITYWSHDLPTNPGVILTVALATLLISNGGFIVNDILDLSIDRINRPDRALPAGRVSTRQAWLLYLTQAVGGVAMAFTINVGAGVVAAIISGGLLLYSAALKKRFLIGHLAIAAMGALLLPYGGIAAGSLTPTVYTIPVVFLAFLGREILKTVPDVEGDRAHGVDNLATRYGPASAAIVGKLLLTACIVLLPMTALVWSLNPWFLLIALLVIAPGTLLVLYVLNRRDAERQMHTILRLSKLLFLLVAAAWLIGSVPG